MEIFIIIFLILINAMFVASEFAIVSAPRVTIEGMAQAGSARAAKVLGILKEPVRQDQYIATAQVGITIASLGLGMYGEQSIAHWLHSFLEQGNFIQAVSIHAVSSALAIFILTYFHIVLGEMVPKSLALQSSQAFLFMLVEPMSFFTRLFWPIIIVLNGTSNFLLRGIGIDRSVSSIAAFTPEEIEFIVQESETEGILSDQMGNMIKELFDFGERIAEDIMVPRVHMVALPMRPTAAQIRDLLTHTLHTRYPVYQTDKDNIVGAVHIKDLGSLLDTEGVCVLPLRPVPFLPCSAPIQTVLDAMKEYSTHMAIVLDEYGGTAGFITIRDIFEEVLGEYDSEEAADIEKLSDGSLRVAGTVRLDEVAEQLGIVLTHEDVTTVSGLVLDQLNRPPREGERIVYESVSIVVVRVEQRAAQLCLISKLPSTELKKSKSS
ncbi:MAG: hemolysin family protein [Candidatus Melainabacteria bacterium]|nr:hemolysin family protein [Candidatus Melainabacteria bacterium]